MKNIIINSLVITAISVSCTNTTEQKTNNTDLHDTIIDTTPKDIVHKKTESTSVLSNDLATLVPIDLLDSKSNDVYERYGIEFSGNCYACDLASLSISKDQIKWTNVCDSMDTFITNNFSFANKNEKTVLTTPERKYILTKMDKAPVYELVIEGKELELNNKRLSIYYTTKESLPLFKEHDCGDFDG